MSRTQGSRRGALLSNLRVGTRKGVPTYGSARLNDVSKVTKGQTRTSAAHKHIVLHNSHGHNKNGRPQLANDRYDIVVNRSRPCCKIMV